MKPCASVFFFHLSKILVCNNLHPADVIICWFCSDKDWEDIKFGVDNEVDFYAVSFVKDAQVVHELKDYLRSKVFGPSSHTYSDAV